MSFGSQLRSIRWLVGSDCQIKNRSASCFVVSDSANFAHCRRQSGGLCRLGLTQGQVKVNFQPSLARFDLLPTVFRFPVCLQLHYSKGPKGLVIVDFLDQSDSLIVLKPVDRGCVFCATSQNLSGHSCGRGGLQRAGLPCVSDMRTHDQINFYQVRVYFATVTT